MNGFSTGEEDSRGAADQICCLVDEGERCSRPAGNASYSKRIQKTVTQRRLKLNLDNMVREKESQTRVIIQIQVEFLQSCVCAIYSSASQISRETHC